MTAVRGAPADQECGVCGGIRWGYLDRADHGRIWIQCSICGNATRVPPIEAAHRLRGDEAGE